MKKEATLSSEQHRKTILSVVLAVICVIYVLPVLTVVINSFKINTFVKTDTFSLPTGESWAGFANFVKGMTFGNYPFAKSVLYSVFITIASTLLILLFTSMAAWYIARVNSVFCNLIYYLCVFSMVVPFQMVMFTLSKTADKLHLNSQIDSAGDRGGSFDRRCGTCQNLFPGRASDDEADADLGRHP